MLSQEHAISHCNRTSETIDDRLPGDVRGWVHSTESFGAVDGPGIRFLIFLQGCSMRCRYCHNPDTWRLAEEAGDGTASKGPWKQMSVDELLKKAERYRSYWRDTGGITVSGGEALLQIDFLMALFEEAHRRRISTVLDTAAQPFTRKQPFFGKFERLMESTNLILLDIKHIDDTKHKILTGHTNENILDCARFLSDIGKPVWIRHVLVPGINDSEEDLSRTADFIRTLTNVRKVEVLPYHTLGTFKWEQLGVDYTLKDVAPPTAEQIAKAREILIK